ncbi:hypothetical protein OHD25_01825 [Escherichia coli]|nr:hypothetical protein [Escherichia coli]
MVASTVAKLATIIDGEEDSSRRMGFETILPLREGNGPTLFRFHPASGVPWQFSVALALSRSTMVDYCIQSPRPHGPHGRTATNPG